MVSISRAGDALSASDNVWKLSGIVYTYFEREQSEW